jgi:pyridoxine 4-dehydrogenase
MRSDTTQRLALDGVPPIRRIGFGAMQLTGPQVWGPYPDHDRGVRLLRSLLDEGVTFIDTADVYGPHTNEELIREALSPYPPELVIATKGGFVRGGPEYASLGWVGNPKYLRQAAVTSLRRLGLDRVPLYYLHSGYATDAPFEEQVGELKAMQDEGLIQHIGLSNVTAEQFHTARGIAPIAAVTAQYNVGNRTGSALFAAASATGTVCSPWHPASLSDGDNPDAVRDLLGPIARAHDATMQQIALAWVLHRSPLMLPIPGTTSISHLRENVAAAAISLSADDVERITALVVEPPDGNR